MNSVVVSDTLPSTQSNFVTSYLACAEISVRDSSLHDFYLDAIYNEEGYQLHPSEKEFGRALTKFLDENRGIVNSIALFVSRRIVHEFLCLGFHEKYLGKMPYSYVYVIKENYYDKSETSH